MKIILHVSAQSRLSIFASDPCLLKQVGNYVQASIIYKNKKKFILVFPSEQA